MTAEVIEGTAVEVIPPERAVVPVQPGQALVAAETPTGPAEMIAKATALADALSAMVSKQQLYTEIRGKKYPHVEAWQTIGRMDNVVARESQPPIRHEDGSYEAFVELIRLSDGMVIGGASALCGTKDDVAGRQDWSKASEPSRRSMAATRATSRAFRGQYAWIMALAGYQPTPADEMPDDPPQAPPRGGFVGTEAHPVPDLSKTPPDGLIGNAVADGNYDFHLHQTPDGWRLPFRVKDGSKSFIAMAHDALAEALMAIKPLVLDERVTVWGWWSDETIPKKGAKPEIHYRILHVDRIQTPDGTLPMVEAHNAEAIAEIMATLPDGPPEQPEFDMAALDAELA